MIIESKAGPTLSNPNTTDSASQAASKARAIATLNQLASQNVVQNQNQVSPEEVGAVRQSDRVENSPEQPPAETKAAEEPISSQYAVLARKEKQLRLRDQQLRQREAAFKASESTRNAPPETSKPAFDESKYVSKDRLSSDPFGALNELGLDYEKLTNLVLNGPTPDQRAQTEYVKKLETRLAALEGRTDETQKAFEERDNQSRQGAVSQIRYEVAKLVKSDPTYEVINATNSVKDVVELIESVFDKGMGPDYPKGTLLTADEAAQMVEDHLIDEAMKFNKINKIQKRLRSGEASAQTQATSRSPQQQQLKTLTNSASSSRKLTSKERAILAFKGELNK